MNHTENLFLKYFLETRYFSLKLTFYIFMSKQFQENINVFSIDIGYVRSLYRIFGYCKNCGYWRNGEYGRCNIGNYSNNTVKYPYEPELPLKSKSGTVYRYTETDFGSTGGFSVTSYVGEYNNGSKISRGTCRIVFTNNAKDASERLVFYTWNHYNDFQEYLNYYDGFGEIFGNMSNGGSYNSGKTKPWAKYRGRTWKLSQKRRIP